MDMQTFDISGPCLLSPTVHGDDRGWFMETFHAQRFAEVTGLSVNFVQDNQSMSAQVGTIRGLHYQSPPHAQAKLVRCVRGSLIDIIVDARRSSSTFGQSLRVELSAKNKQQFFVPAGFLHGFATLEPNTEIAYKCSDYYARDCDGAVSFASPSLGLDWGVSADQASLSDKDRNAVNFADWDSPFD